MYVHYTFRCILGVWHCLHQWILNNWCRRNKWTNTTGSLPSKIHEPGGRKQMCGMKARNSYPTHLQCNGGRAPCPGAGKHLEILPCSGHSPSLQF